MINKDTSFLSCFQRSFRCALHCTENSRGGGTVLPNGWICVTFTSRCTYSSHSFLQQLRKLLDFAIWHTKQFAVWIGFVYHHDEVNKKTQRDLLPKARIQQFWAQIQHTCFSHIIKLSRWQQKVTCMVTVHIQLHRSSAGGAMFWCKNLISRLNAHMKCRTQVTAGFCLFYSFLKFNKSSRDENLQTLSSPSLS